MCLFPFTSMGYGDHVHLSPVRMGSIFRQECEADKSSYVLRSWIFDVSLYCFLCLEHVMLIYALNSYYLISNTPYYCDNFSAVTVRWECLSSGGSDVQNCYSPKRSIFLTQYCAGDKIEKNEMGWACGAYG